MVEDFEARPADDQPPILTCSRIGCRCTVREELIYIVGEQYYCKRCFGEFAQRHELGKLTRWEWITGFRAWAATTPVLNEYLQQEVDFAAFERQARTLARSPEVESLEELAEDIQDRLRLLHDDEHPPEDDDGGHD
jgi:hypothetical protein